MVTTEQKLGIIREAGYSIEPLEVFLNTAPGRLIRYIEGIPPHAIQFLAWNPADEYGLFVTARDLGMLADDVIVEAKLTKVLEALPGYSHEDDKESEKATLQVTLNIDYDLKGVPLATIQDHLQSMLHNAIGNGLLTGDHESIVDEWHMMIYPVTPEEGLESQTDPETSSNLKPN